ncbi:carbohydrate-binding protein [Streptosporangium sp. NPDC002721]|uniref:carbohydrate-binding protein n=1 Tax=Streptosporangium sp. NPDC002721 TaxID=3366188 RepID=UPI00368B27DC
MTRAPTSACPVPGRPRISGPSSGPATRRRGGGTRRRPRRRCARAASAPTSGFCNGDAAVRAYAQFTVNASAAGTATLGIRFANGANGAGSGGARPANLIVNGSTVGTVSFESTGAWTTWVTKTVTVPLNNGGSTVRLDPATAAGLPNLDHLDVNG